MNTGVLNPRSEMQSLLQRIAGNEGSVKVRITKAARRVGLTFNRAKDCWYSDERISIKAEEIERARLAARQVLGAAKNDIETLQARIESLEATVRALLAR